MFDGSSEYTAFHDVGSVHVFLFFAKGTVRVNIIYKKKTYWEIGHYEDPRLVKSVFDEMDTATRICYAG